MPPPPMLAAHHQDDLTTLALDRPDRRNTLVPELLVELAAQLRALPADTRAVVLTGSGDQAFCLGADLTWLGSLADPAAGVARLVAAHHQAVRALRQAPVPVVAAVNGAAAGGGVGLALAADYRVASLGASFTAAYFRLGLTPDGGASSFLARAIGSARALDLLLSNRTLSADEAFAWGLVNGVVPAGALRQRARAVATRLAGVAPETLRETRRLLDTATARPLDAQLDEEERAMVAAASRPAFGEALRRFLERREA